MASQRVPTAESPLELFERATRGASNDEALEMSHRILELLAERVENAADLALEVDDRDVENEALVFMGAVSEVLNSFARSGRLREAWHKVYDATKDVQAAASNRRARLGGARTSLEKFSYRRMCRIETASQVQRRRKRDEAARLIERAVITPDRVREAFAKAASANPSGVQVRDVAVAMMPELADTRLPGRQAVINRVGAVLRQLVRGGEVAQRRPADSKVGRETCRYSLLGAETG